MKITVLGIDGLDFGMVKELDLENLKQKRYGKLKIPEECYIHIGRKDAVPWTPLCWMTIITGRTPPSKYQEQTPTILKNPAMEKIRKSLGFIKGKARALEKFGFRPHQWKWGNVSRRHRTIFDLAKKSLDFNVPTYSEDWILGPVKKRKVELKDYLKFIDDEYWRIRHSLFSILEGKQEYDILMCYMGILDAYGHCFYRHEKYYQKYIDVDEFIGRIRENVDGMLLVVSDHGFEKLEGVSFGGKHSDYAFYSTNISSFNTEMNDLTDVYGLVKEMSLK